MSEISSNENIDQGGCGYSRLPRRKSPLTSCTTREFQYISFTMLTKAIQCWADCWEFKKCHLLQYLPAVSVHNRVWNLSVHASHLGNEKICEIIPNIIWLTSFSLAVMAQVFYTVTILSTISNICIRESSASCKSSWELTYKSHLIIWNKFRQISMNFQISYIALNLA